MQVNSAASITSGMHAPGSACNLPVPPVTPLLLLLLAEIAGMQARKAHPILLLVPMRPNCAPSQRLSPHQASLSWSRCCCCPFLQMNNEAASIDRTRLISNPVAL